ncbi:MAG TPA: condensation domain-containing protein, partial [Minicystis sp.]|nr:condensation domain-containing protein [Minicystis sp.]
EPGGDVAPIGVWGELCLGGAGVARGYLGDPAATAERFTPDPFVAGARVLRTGDRARRRADGVLEYAGRLDDRVKIRGVRVEPAEVEQALREHPGVADCVVLARPAPDGDARLVAWFVPAEGAAPPRASELRAHLRGSLPDAMIPGAYVALDALPLKAGGKIDRDALPSPGASPEEDTRPRTPTEIALAEIWQAILGGGPYGVEDDFFAAGGHSLLIAELATRVRAAFFVEPPLAALFQASTIADQARRIDAMRASGASATHIEPVPRAPRMPLSFAQERIWLAEAVKEDADPHVVSLALRLRGRIDAGRLEAAMERVAARHEPLRTTFSADVGVPNQTVHDALARDHARVDLTHLDAPARAAEVARMQASEYRRRLDLERGPPYRTRLVRLAEDEHVLLCTMSHLVSDGWSMRRWVDDVDAVYRGKADALSPLSVQLADVAVWQRRASGFGAFEEERAYFRQVLGDGRSPRELPSDGPRGKHAAAWRNARVDAGLAADLRRLARAEETTLFTVILAAIARVFARVTNDPVFTTGALVAGRDRPETKHLLGLFLNTVPVRVDTAGASTFRELVRRARDAAKGAFSHGAIPFERIVADLNPPRQPGRNPIFDVAINYLPPASPFRLGDLRVSALDPPRTLPAPFDVMWRLIERGGGLSVRVEYRADRFAAARVDGWLADVLDVLRGAR